jgi:hypothetical protein
MNFAEGKGPKQVKKPYVLGNFQTIYANDGVPGGAVAFSGSAYSVVQGANTVSGQTWTGGIVASVVPGLNLNVNGNGSTDVGFVCSPGSNESIQDIQSPWVSISSDVNFSGNCNVWIQGTSNRYLNGTVYSGSNWITITGTTISGANATATITTSGAAPIYNAYRLIASGSTASGIINWAIAGMFTDFSAMGVGNNASDANGNIGQMSIQGPRYLTISGGAITSTTNGSVPYAATKNDVDYYG